jgi:nucleotide-binding universal stress UspA family protein
VQVVIPNNGKQTGAITDDLLRYAQSIAGDRGRAMVVLDDDPALAIVRAAEENSIDVLVVGNAGMAGRRQFLLSKSRVSSACFPASESAANSKLDLFFRAR